MNRLVAQTGVRLDESVTAAIVGFLKT